MSGKRVDGNQLWPLLAERFDLSSARLNPSALLFAVHVYFALVAETVCAALLTRNRQTDSPVARLQQACAAGKGAEELLRLGQQGRYTLSAFEGSTAADRAAQLGNLWNKHLADAIGQLAVLALRWVAKLRGEQPSGDLFGTLYQALIPRQVRHALGEYYTPVWLAEHILDLLDYHPDPQQRLLDPSCGSGAFLVAAIQRIVACCRASRTGTRGSTAIAPLILANIRGCDTNPIALTAAWANYRIAASNLGNQVHQLLEQRDDAAAPLLLGDSILEASRLAGMLGRFDYVVGNPPWIVWDNLPAEYRAATAELWQKYGLFSLSARQARHGGGKKDLAALMLYTAADWFLKAGSRLGMVIPQTLLHTKGAGDGFRRFRLGPQGEPLEVLRVDDLVALRPFAAANRTATIVLQKGSPTRYPVGYIRWMPLQKKDSSQDGDSPRRARRAGTRTNDTAGWRKQLYNAQPAPGGGPGAPWILLPEALDFDLARLVRPSDYLAHLGANSAGASSVYWLEVVERCGGLVRVRNLPTAGKHQVEAVEALLEPDLLYPLLRWGEVDRWRATPNIAILLVQDVHTRTGIPEKLLREQYPHTAKYLKRFEELLRARAAYRRYQSRGPYYAMYNVGPYTLAQWKVVWRRMDKLLRAAVVGPMMHPMLGLRPVVPQETCVLVATDTSAEAHYLCALLNSVVAGFLVSAHSVTGGKGFGTPSILDFMNIRRFDAANARHCLLAALSRRAHQAAASGRSCSDIQHRIDMEAAALWGLSSRQCRRIAEYLQISQSTGR